MKLQSRGSRQNSKALKGGDQNQKFQSKRNQKCHQFQYKQNNNITFPSDQTGCWAGEVKKQAGMCESEKKYARRQTDSLPKSTSELLKSRCFILDKSLK